MPEKAASSRVRMEQLFDLVANQTILASAVEKGRPLRRIEG
jgi:hypothetical protein